VGNAILRSPVPTVNSDRHCSSAHGKREEKGEGELAGERKEQLTGEREEKRRR
jgi:hypothetical protein